MAFLATDFFPAGLAAATFFLGEVFLAGAAFFVLAGDFTFLTALAALGLASAGAFLALGAAFFGDADLAGALGFLAFTGDFLATVAFGFFSAKRVTSVRLFTKNRRKILTDQLFWPFSPAFWQQLWEQLQSYQRGGIGWD